MTIYEEISLPYDLLCGVFFSKRFLVVFACIFSLFLGCADSPDPFCGDGHLDKGEGCDDGNRDNTDFCLNTCAARKLSSLTIKWAFNRNQALAFSGDACIDMKASKVEVQLLNGPSGTENKKNVDSCAFKQSVFSDIPKGKYLLNIRVLDKNGLALTKRNFESEIDFNGDVETKEVTIPAEYWKSAYEGTFFFRVTWGGKDCTDAMPNAVVKQRLTLQAGGAIFEGNTSDGVALDGSATSACVPLTNEFPQAALEVPFGAASFKVEGLDSLDTTIYEGVFETFVGAGVNNPELIFNVIEKE